MSSPKVAEYKRKLASTLLSDSSLAASNGDCSDNSKILHFKERAPEPKITHNNNNLKVLYSQNKCPAAEQQSKKSYRHIPSQAEKILDAPDFTDDYYLNLLSWGSNNVLAIALDSALYMWNAATGDIQCLLDTANPSNPQAHNPITSVSWVKQGNYIAVGFDNSDVQLWDAEQGRMLRTMKGHAARVSALDWNNHILSSGSRDTNIINHDVRIANHVVSTLSGHTQEICGLKWSEDGTQLASGGNDNLVQIWSLASATTANVNASPMFTFNQHQAAVKALAWCPWQQNLLATGGGSADRTIRFWNTSNGQCVNSIDTYSQVCALTWSKHEKEIVSAHGYSQNQISIWKYPSLVKVADLTGHTSRVLAMAQSPDGCTVVSASADETLRFWKCLGPNETKITKVAAAKAAVTPNFMNSVTLR
eukprot:c1354_g1_i1.p1 GENE.c1354_g1_i1~~c1354_g1_i1.p1  ORF type:complete len:420 (+),score=90.63 c1354_g1_i1:450-1709(+)